MLNKAAETTRPTGPRRKLPRCSPRRATPLVGSAKVREARLCRFERDLVSTSASAAGDLIASGVL